MSVASQFVVKYIINNRKCKNFGYGIYASLSNAQNLCWRCGGNVSSIFCEKCAMIQKPDTKTNYFDLLGIKYSFDIDVPDLVTKYRAMQNILHPDKFANRSEEEFKISETYSSLVNKAYSTLLHPIKRGLYMLQQRNSTMEDTYTPIQGDFLTTIMELNEELESAGDVEKVKMLESKIQKEVNGLILNISDAFIKNDLEEAKLNLTKLKYYASINDAIKERLYPED